MLKQSPGSKHYLSVAAGTNHPYISRQLLTCVWPSVMDRLGNEDSNQRLAVHSGMVLTFNLRQSDTSGVCFLFGCDPVSSGSPTRTTPPMSMY